jgi:hypothetical protein
MLKFILCEPLNSIEKALGDREKVNEIKKSCEWLLEVFNDRCPPGVRIIFNLYLVC